MKKFLKTLLTLLLSVLTLASLFSCDNIGKETSAVATSSVEAPQSGSASDNTSNDNSIPAEGLWKDAIYRSNQEFGNGSKTVTVEVKVEDKSVILTLKTNKNTLGEALLEHSLLDGEQGAYGLYVKKVNGITADYDIDKSYWGFYKSGAYMMTGVDATQISDGEHYELVYTK